MKKILFALSVPLAAWMFGGCGHTPVRETHQMAIPPLKADEATVQQRTERFKKATAPMEVRAVALFPAAFSGNFSDAQVLDAVQEMGFNRVYCCLSSEQELNGRLTEFLTAASARKLPVEIVLSQQDFYRSYHGNRLIRNAFIQYPDLFEAVQEAVAYNLELPENIRFAGITVRLTPHIFDGSNTERLKGKLYMWSSKNYGIGRDNDMLMRESLKFAKEIAAIPGLPSLTLAVPDFFHDNAVNNLVSCGRISDFEAIADKVMVISSANLPGKIPENIAGELSAMPVGKKLIVAVPLADHTSVTSDRLRRRNWDDFSRTMEYLAKKSGTHPAFGGVIVSPLAVIEYMRQEK